MATHKEALNKALEAWWGECAGDFTPEEYDFNALDMNRALRAYLDAMDAVIVPKEPTQTMLDEVTAADQHEPFSDSTMRETYRSMLAAAPNPFKDEDNDR